MIQLVVRDGLLFGCTTQQLAPGPAPSPTTAVNVVASVGSAGRNLRTDVLAIQGALNKVDPSEGGADPALAVDGICGPVTTRAIGKFQRRALLAVVDSRIDPHGPTLAALNARLSAPAAARGRSVSGKDGDGLAGAPVAKDEVQIVLDHIPSIRGALFLARNRIESIRPFVTATGLVPPSGSGSERDRFNLELVDEVFRLSDFVNPLGSYQTLRFHFEGMLQSLRTCDPSKGAVDNGLFLKNQSPSKETAVAYVARSGKFDAAPTGELDDGILISTKRIYITKVMKNPRANRRDVIDIVVHELAHFCSAPGFTVLDPHPGHSPFVQDRFRSDVYNRIFNAENYGWFTWRSFEGPFAF